MVVSKEESQRGSAQGHASSVPPRVTASQQPRAIPPSIPPVTDEIDTDWGAAEESSEEVTRIAPAPRSNPLAARESVVPPTRVSAVPFVSPSIAPEASPSGLPPRVKAISSAPESAAGSVASEAKSTPRTLPPQADVPQVRDVRQHAQTLIGVPLTATATPIPSASVAPDAPSDATPREPSARPLPHAQTLIGSPAPNAGHDSRTPSSESATATPLAGSAPQARAGSRASAAPPPPPPAPIASPIASPAPFAATLLGSPPPASSASVAGAASAPEQASVAPVAAASQSPVPRSDVAPRSAEPEAGTGFGRWLAVLGVAVIIVGVVGYRVLSRQARPAPTPIIAAAAPAEPATATPEPAATAVAPPASEPANTTPSASAAVAAEGLPSESASAPEPSASATADLAASAAPVASAEPAPSSAPSSAAAAAGSAEPAGSTDEATISVLLKSSPPKARFFHFGKEVGVAPFVLKLKPGEKHAYEAGLPGYITRKVVVDGSKSEITVGMTKESH